MRSWLSLIAAGAVLIGCGSSTNSGLNNFGGGGNSGGSGGNVGAPGLHEKPGLWRLRWLLRIVHLHHRQLP